MSTTTLKPASQRAQEEFAFVDLGEPGLNKRVVKIATNLAANPGGTLPPAFPDWAELKAAYRFFDNPVVDFLEGGPASFGTDAPDLPRTGRVTQPRARSRSRIMEFCSSTNCLNSSEAFWRPCASPWKKGE